MTNIFSILLLTAIAATSAHAGMWESLSDADRNTLSSSCYTPLCDQVVKIRNRARRTLHRNERDLTTGDPLPAIFDEVTIYILVNASKSRTGAVFSDYDHYTSYFGSVGMEGASVVGGTSMPNPRVRYDLHIPVVDQTVRYELNNRWVCRSGNLKDTWEIADPDSNADVAHVEGESEYETVTLADGTTRTLVRYYNYLNVRNPSGREQLDNGAARSTNVLIARNMMRQLRNAAQDAPPTVVAAERALTAVVNCP